MTIKDDYSYCEEIIKRHSTSFYNAFRILPSQKRNAIFAVYAFCRMADDAVDIDASQSSLNALKDSINKLKDGIIMDDPVFRALSDTLKTYPINLKYFNEMLEGQSCDLNHTAFSDIDQLERYSYLVAGTVGLMILPIIATKNANVLEPAAIKLGYAMQLTNILRDVGEDLLKNRIYIPNTLLVKHHANLRQVDQNFINTWKELESIARSNYIEFSKSLSLFDKDSVKAVKRSMLYYQSILDAVRKNNYDCINKRAFISPLKKIDIYIRTLL